MSQDGKLDEILLKLSRIEKAMDIVPDFETEIADHNASLEEYRVFARDTLKLKEITINNQKSVILGFLRHSKGKINKDTVKEYLDSNESLTWKTNQIKALRRYLRDFLKLGKWIEEFDFSESKVKPKEIPSDEQLIEFFNLLPEQVQVVFLFLLTSGLRLGEVMSLRLDNIDLETNMIDASNIHSGKTKHSWISFFTQQACEYLTEYLEREDKFEDPDLRIFSLSMRSIQQAFKNASDQLGLSINPHLLRTIFVEKCTLAKIPDKYIDALCGRVPQTVLAKNYTDYSPKSLRQQYDSVEYYLTLGQYEV
jgi:integrase